MTRQIAPANLLLPNINIGCILKISAEGRVLEALWDREAHHHPMVTSCKEHKGHLYIGGIANNRIGRWAVPGADPNWTGPRSYWGTQARSAKASS